MKNGKLQRHLFSNVTANISLLHPIYIGLALSPVTAGAIAGDNLSFVVGFIDHVGGPWQLGGRLPQLHLQLRETIQIRLHIIARPPAKKIIFINKWLYSPWDNLLQPFGCLIASPVIMSHDNITFVLFFIIFIKLHILQIFYFIIFQIYLFLIMFIKVHIAQI